MFPGQRVAAMYEYWERNLLSGVSLIPEPTTSTTNPSQYITHNARNRQLRRSELGPTACHGCHLRKIRHRHTGGLVLTVASVAVQSKFHDIFGLASISTFREMILRHEQAMGAYVCAFQLGVIGTTFCHLDIAMTIPYAELLTIRSWPF